MTRHQRLTPLLALALTFALVGCGDDDDAPLAPDAGMPDLGREDAGPPDSGRPPYDAGPITRIPEVTAREGRTGCTFERGAMPWETIGEEHPIGDDIPIDHFILLMQENRSFDHYFGQMPGVDGHPAGASNPRDDGTSVAPFHLDTYCTEDTAHGWSASHTQWGGGANDGFVVTNDPEGERAMGYYDESDLPFYYDLYGTFAMSDHHHCSVLGPTWVNREFFLSGTSFGLIGNEAIPAPLVAPDRGDFVIFQLLDLAGVDWSIYYEVLPFVYGPFPSWSFEAGQRRHFKRGNTLLADIDAGNLAPVVWVDPTWDFSGGVDATDEHPHANVQNGQAWIREIISHVMASPLWERTAIIVTYDEHGGFYDHVPPPAACVPDDLEPGGDEHFDRLGFRVPLVVISPYSRPAYVSPEVTDHTSITRLIEARYLLPALTARDANAWPLLDMFDFSTATFATPPTLAEAPVDAAELAECHANF